ncbi:MAG TPA: HAD-IA family hydrolase [Gemmataceae bacterium]|nr:HAD-IA family hydrolase [Gemmataceae bacterium]
MQKAAMLTPAVRVVFFDAVGTLIYPHPSASAVYAAVGRRHGSRLTEPEIASRFRAAFRRTLAEDEQNDLRTDEARERRRWQEIVAAVLDDVTDGQACFQELFAHFAGPEAWACVTGAGPVLVELARRGYRLGIASNYDSRLRRVMAGLSELAPIREAILSAEVGWRKPAPEFFAALCRQTGLAPGQIALVGDDRVNDFEGGRAVGLQVVLFDPHGREPTALRPRVARLDELLPPTSPATAPA